jgi:GT2 family glycosyltransferase
MTIERDKPRVAVLVLNWNNAQDTLSCLESLEHLEVGRVQIIVVDNGSSDDSVAAIEAAFPDIVVLANGQNLGYAAGNNVGIRLALDQDMQYVCILNNDTVAESGFLSRLSEVMSSDSSIGVVTPVLVEDSDPDLVWAAGANIDNEKGIVVRNMSGNSLEALNGKQPFEVDVAPGAAMLVKSEVFREVGLFDDDYFLYYEEVDWCNRVRKRGYRIVLVPSSRVRHKVSATLGRYSPTTDYYLNRNVFRYILRNWKGAKRWRLLARHFVGQTLTVSAYTLKRRSEPGRLASRDARLRALADAFRGRWGPRTPDN